MSEMTGIDNLFSKEVLEKLERLQRATAKKITENAVAKYEDRYAYVKRNWEDQGVKFPMPEVPVMGLVFNPKTYRLDPVEMPGYPKTAPWDFPETPNPAGFGLPIWNSNPVCYSVTGGGSAGEKQTQDGQEYILVESGQRGTFTFIRMWVAV